MISGVTIRIRGFDFWLLFLFVIITAEIWADTNSNDGVLQDFFLVIGTNKRDVLKIFFKRVKESDIVPLHSKLELHNRGRCEGYSHL